MQAKVADENRERLLQEIVQRERECNAMREYSQREKTTANTQLRELQEKLYELQDRLRLTLNENKNLFEKLKKSEDEIEKLKVLNTRKAQEVDEKVIIVEKPSGQVTYSEVKVKEREEKLIKTSDKLIDRNLHVSLKRTTTKLEEVQEMQKKEAETKKNEFEAKLNYTRKSTENLKPEGSLRCNSKLLFVRFSFMSDNSQNIAVY